MAEKSLIGSDSDARELRKRVEHDQRVLTVSRPCELLGLPRSTLDDQPLPVRESMLRILARIVAFHLEAPTAGSRRLVPVMARDGIPTSRDHGRNLLRHKELRAIDQKPRTTVPGEPAECFPRLVDFRAVTALDGVWVMDITYIPLRKGFLHLVAVMDHSPDRCSVGSIRSLWLPQSATALTWSFAWRPWPWPVAASPRSFIPIMVVNSPHRPLFNDSRHITSRSPGQAGGGALSTSWWSGCGALSSMRRCICVSIAKAGKWSAALRTGRTHSPWGLH